MDSIIRYVIKQEMQTISGNVRVVVRETGYEHQAWTMLGDLGRKHPTKTFALVETVETVLKGVL